MTKLCSLTALLCGLFAVQARANFSYGFKQSSQLDWSAFEYLLESSEAKTIEEFLPSLKQLSPDHFENYILMYRSKSLQQASFQSPRLISFDASGQFVFSFNGHRRQRGFDAIEVMHYLPESQSFEFREVVFTAGKSPEISAANPPKCLECHQSSGRQGVDPRPNWEPYNIWPGAYGSDSGRVPWGNQVSHFLRELVEANGSDQVMLDEQLREREELTRFFLENKPNHPRYKHFGFKDLSDRKLIEEEPRRYRRMMDEFAHGTVKFTQFLANLNAERVIRLIQQAKVWEALKWPMISSLKCGDWQLETELVDTLIGLAPPQFIARSSTRVDHSRPLDPSSLTLGYDPQVPLSREEIEAFKQERIRQHAAWLASLADHRSFSLSERIFLLFEGHGIDIEDWSMDFKTEGRFAFRERFGTPSNTTDTFRFAARKLLPASDWELDCSQLRVRGNHAVRVYQAGSRRFQEWRANKGQVDNFADHRPLLNACIRCHHQGASSGSSVPFIPFGDEAWLRQHLAPPEVNIPFAGRRTLLSEITHRLSDHATLEEQMPPSNRRPSLSQRRALIEYFQNLSEE